MTDKRETTEGKAFLVDGMSAGLRLDAYIASRMPDHISRSRIKDIIKQGGVTVNADVCESPNYRLKADDEILLSVPEAQDAVPKPEPIELDIRFEDDDLLVINKAAGMVVHPAVGNWSGTLVNALLYHCGDSLSGIGGVRRPGIVHRLDKDTSGLIVVAKNEATHAGLSAQFKDHGRTGSLERSYIALVWGRPDPFSGTVTTYLARSPSNRRRRAVVPEDRQDAKLAITHYKVLQSFHGEDVGKTGISLINCQLETGRTHQIRVHMAHIGHPLLGDQEYGKHFQTKVDGLSDWLGKRVRSFRRQALHAAVLGFEHPTKREFLRFEAPPPPDFDTLLKALVESGKRR